MSATVIRRWCACGATLDAHVFPPASWLGVAEYWASQHTGEGHGPATHPSAVVPIEPSPNVEKAREMLADPDGYFDRARRTAEEEVRRAREER